MAQKLVTPVVRCSFPHLADTHVAPGSSTPKYSIALMLDKKDPEHMAFMKLLKQDAAKTAVDKHGKKVWEDAKPGKWRWPWRDGDQEGRPEWEGHWILNASANEQYRPRIVGPDLRELTKDEVREKVYAGSWVRVSMNHYAWGPNVGGSGVSLGLRNVQKVRDDEPFGSASRPEDDFEAFDATDDGFESDFNEEPAADDTLDVDLDDDLGAGDPALDDDDEELF